MLYEDVPQGVLRGVKPLGGAMGTQKGAAAQIHQMCEASLEASA